MPLLTKDNQLVSSLREALEKSDAAEFLFGDGLSEVTITWFCSTEGTKADIPAKARADRIQGKTIFDVKTAHNASDEAFEYACLLNGHHMRAAWYLDGWAEALAQPQETQIGGAFDYKFIIVDKRPPHLVSVKQLDARAIEWGRRLYRLALTQFRRGQETGVWSGYNREDRKANIVSLPVSAEYRYADMETRAGL